MSESVMIPKKQMTEVRGIRLMPVGMIKVGERRRDDVGDLGPLKQSIQRWGILHTLVVDTEGWLVAGQRRLRSAQELGMSEVPVRFYEDLTAEEKREIELDENATRKELTAYESAKDFLKVAEQLSIEPADKPFARSSEQKTETRGRKRKRSTTQRQMAAATGKSKGKIGEAESIVDTAEECPFMQTGDWSENAILDARRQLKALPDADREILKAICSEPATLAKSAQQMIARAAAMPAGERTSLLSRYSTDDPRQRSLVKTILAEVPPSPDQRLVTLSRMIREVKELQGRKPVDPDVNNRLGVAIQHLQAAVGLIELKQKELRNEVAQSSENGTNGKSEAGSAGIVRDAAGALS